METPTSQDLENARAELEQLRQETARLRAELSQDLRTGLNAILGFAELMQLNHDGSDLESVQQILKAGRELLAIVDRKLSAHAATENGKQGSPLLHGCDLLYIEDNDANFALVQHMLDGRFSLQRAVSGAAGLTLAQDQRPRLILLDLNLPDIHGSEILHRLRAGPETNSIPVIIISADATASQIERLLAAGARNYITKPFRIPFVLAIIEEALAETGTVPANDR